MKVRVRNNFKAMCIGALRSLFFSFSVKVRVRNNFSAMCIGAFRDFYK